jgi:hypothetical protein
MELSELEFRIETDSNGVVTEVKDKPTGFWDELILQIEYNDKLGNSHTQWKYLNDKHRLIRLKLIVDEVPKVK